MGDRMTMSMSISADSLSDVTSNRGPLALLLRRQYEFPLRNYQIFNFQVFDKRLPVGIVVTSR